jgi:hypothetical protein
MLLTVPATIIMRIMMVIMMSPEGKAAAATQLDHVARSQLPGLDVPQASF